MRGLTFSAEQVKAILAGTMTETRRIIAVEPWDSEKQGRRMEFEAGDQVEVYEPYLHIEGDKDSLNGQTFWLSEDVTLFEADDLDSVDRVPQENLSTAFEMAAVQAEMELSRIVLTVKGVEVHNKLGCVELYGAMGNEYALVAIKFEVAFAAVEAQS